MAGINDFIDEDGNFKDYYKILGIPRDADETVENQAYRNEANKWHPDKHMGKSTLEDANRRMKAINEAHNVLGNSYSKQLYDSLIGNISGGQANGKAEQRAREAGRNAEQRANDASARAEQHVSDAQRRAGREARGAGRRVEQPANAAGDARGATGGADGDFGAYKKEVEDAFRRAQAEDNMPTDEELGAMWGIHNKTGSPGSSGSNGTYHGQPRKVTIKGTDIPQTINIENGLLDVVLETCDDSDLTIDGKFDRYEPQGRTLNLRNLNGKVVVPRSAYGRLELIVETGSGAVKGSIATSAHIKTFSGGVEVRVEALLNYTLTVGGRLVAETPVGPPDYKLPAGRDVGSLKVETSIGYAKVTANARQGAAR